MSYDLDFDLYAINSFFGLCCHGAKCFTIMGILSFIVGPIIKAPYNNRFKLYVPYRLYFKAPKSPFMSFITDAENSIYIFRRGKQ